MVVDFVLNYEDTESGVTIEVIRWRLNISKEELDTLLMDYESIISEMESRYGILEPFGHEIKDGHWEIGYDSYEITNWEVIINIFRILLDRYIMVEI